MSEHGDSARGLPIIDLPYIEAQFFRSAKKRTPIIGNGSAGGKPICLQ